MVGGGLCAAGWISNTLIKFADYILEVLLLRGHTFIPFLHMICFIVPLSMASLVRGSVVN